MTQSSPAALSCLERGGKPGWKGALGKDPLGHLGGTGEARLARSSGALPLASPAALSCVGCGRRAVFRARLAGRCELHPAAQIKGTSASNIHQKAFNAQPWSREICSRDSFPCLNVKNCVNLTFRKFYLIPFYSFNSLANCSALFLLFLYTSF